MRKGFALRLGLGALAALVLAGAAPSPIPSPPPSPTPTPTQTPRALTLEEAVDAAIRNASSVIRTSNQKDLAGAQLLQSYAQFLPNLNAGASYSYQSGQTLYTINGASLVDSNNRSSAWTVSSTLNLFNGLADLGGFKSALASRRSADLTWEFARQQVAFDVTQSYLQVLLDRALISVDERSLAASQSRLKLLQAEAEVGTISTADLFRQQAQTSSDLITLMSARTRMHDDTVLLLRKIQMDPATDVEVQPTSLLPVSPLLQESQAVLIERALKGRKDFQAAGADVESAGWKVTSARSGFFPRLDLSIVRQAGGHYLITDYVNGQVLMPAYQTPLSSQLSEISSYTVALTLSWNLFDRLVTYSNVKAARVAELNLEQGQDDLRLLIIGQVRQAKLDFDTAAAQLQSAKIGVEAAQKAFEVIEGRYRTGSANFTDVLTAQAALVQAQSTQAQSEIGVKLQEKFLTYAVGEF